MAKEGSPIGPKGISRQDVWRMLVALLANVPYIIVAVRR
jgi:hypothetical protein